MIKTPNPGQIKALEHEGDLIISAAAGAGKTAVMVGRAARLVTNGCDVRRILMVTFTNKAAAEMKQRIKADLAEAANSEGVTATDRRRLRRQMSLVDSADICTIHSFCIRLVRQYFQLAGVDPMFRMAGETETVVYRLQALDTLLDELYNGDDLDGFRLQLRALAGGSEHSLRSLIQRAYEYAMASPDPDGWLDKSIAVYDDDAEIQRQAARSLEAAQMNIVNPLEKAAFLMYGLENQLDGKGAESAARQAEAYSGFATQCRDALAFGAGMKALDKMPAYSDIKAPAKIKDADEGTMAEAKALVSEAKDALKKLAKDSMFLPGPDVCAGQQHEMGEYVAVLAGMVRRYRQLYADIKQQENALDFSDAEHLAYAVLRDETARAEIMDGYDYVFVDEYQDTNDIQEAIVTSVARPGSLFCVGDVKQSIYAFRHAEPAIFMERYSKAGQDGRVDLNLNYRSNPGLLSGINRVFRSVMTEDLGSVDYDETQMLHPGRPDGGAKAELELIAREGNSAEGAQGQAIICAAKIEGLLDEEFVDKGTTRRFTYGDIAVLLPTLKGNGGEYIETLQACGIPVVGSARKDFYSEGEVSAVLCILRLLDNGMDDLSLIGALRSPAAGFSAEDLARLRLADRERPLYEVAAELGGAVQASANTDRSQAADETIDADDLGDISSRLRSFYAHMSRWQMLSQASPVHELVADIIDSTGMAAEYALLPDGEAQSARLDGLVGKAREFSSFSSGGLSAFLQLVDMQAGQDNHQQPSSTPDAVSVMTIHASKGLEFPAVICGLVDRKFPDADTKGSILDKHMGIGLAYYSAELDARGDTSLRVAMKERKRAAAISEQMRLLYVALTRAQERLILTAAMKPEKYIAALSKPAGEAGCWLDWILPSVIEGELPDDMAVEDIEKHSCADWAVTIHPMPELDQVGSRVEHDWGEFVEANGNRGNRWIAETLAWEYPHMSAVNVPSKVAASAIGEERVLPELKPPLFMSGQKGYTAAERGSIIHKAMMLANLDDAATPEAVRAQLESFVQNEQMEAGHIQLIEPEMICRFAASPLGMRARAAGPELMREKHFNLLISAGEVLPNGGGEQLLVQGVIDMAFIEGGEWVIVDYKTGRLRGGGVDAVAETYAGQMGIYARALAEISGKPVREVYIHMLAEGVDVDMSGYC